ncbi:hypothetical protein Gorai_009078, partial [Gossypium raimondii]|nr:hypothetical protein [Gossypium raimondii]
SLNAYRRTGDGRFIGCEQLLLAWFHSHFWKVDKVSYQVFSKNYSPLKELAAKPRHDNITEERWIAILQNLQDEDVEWKAPWLVPMRFYIDVETLTGFARCEFSYKGDNYNKKIREMSNAWNQMRQMKRFAVGPMTTPKYFGWWNKRVNENIPGPSQEGVRLMEEYLQVVSSEIEIIKQDFEREIQSYERRSNSWRRKNCT